MDPQTMANLASGGITTAVEAGLLLERGMLKVGAGVVGRLYRICGVWSIGFAC
jgi:hypothetical protein